MRAKDTPRPDSGRTRKCRTCRVSFPAGQIFNGQCPSCAGMQALPLRGEGGRFLPGLAPAKSVGAVRGRRSRMVTFGLSVVLPLLVLASCEDGVPFFPDGVLPARMQAHSIPVGVWLVLVGVLGLVAVVVAGMACLQQLPAGCRERHRLNRQNRRRYRRQLVGLPVVEATGVAR